MKEYHVNIFYSEEDKGFIADIPDLKYCSAFGKTRKEALKQIEIAESLWLETAKAAGITIPEPKYSPVDVSENNTLAEELEKAALVKAYDEAKEAGGKNLDYMKIRKRVIKKNVL